MNERLLVEAAFFAALDKAAPTERAACLEETCAGNKTLRHRVEDLLAAVPQVGQFLERPIAGAEGVAALGTGENAGPELSFLGPPSAPGSLGRLDQFEVLEVIGQGGTGVVLRARDTKLERIIALKVLAAPLVVSGTARQRFAREARAAAAVRDEHVVAIHAVYDEAPVPYLVMEFIDGCNLETHVRRPLPTAPAAGEEGRASGRGAPLEVLEVLRIGLHVASGLAAAHRRGLIHRDVKPANILLENGVQRVKLTDFGLARAADDASLTQTGFIAGTPLYMAPEQAAGEPIDARSDLFSLGSVLYELCAGCPAFRAPSTVAVIRRICDETPRPLREVNPDLPEGLCRLIEQLQAKKPADRPASAQEVADRLAQLLADQSCGKSRAADRTAARKAAARLAGLVRRRWHWAAVAMVLLAGGLGVGEATGVTDVRGTVVRLFSPHATRLVTGNGGQVARVSREVEPPTVAGSWEKSVAVLPAEEQVEAFARRLKECNPRFNRPLEPPIPVEATIRDGVVTGVRFDTDRVEDLSPVRALTRLESLDCRGSADRTGMVSDLTPLRGLPLRKLIFSNNRVIDLSPLGAMPLRELRFRMNLSVKDLSPLRGMPLEFLECGHTGVADLSPLEGMRLTVFRCDVARLVSDLRPLRGMRLKELRIPYTRVSDLTPLRGMPLEVLTLISTPVSDLSPLRGMPLTDVALTDTPVSDLSPLEGMRLTFLAVGGSPVSDRISDLSPVKGMPLTKLWLTFRPERDAEIVRSLTTLQFINDKPAADFWKEVDGPSEGTPIVEVDDSDPWERSVAVLPPAEQVAAVERRLRELNPEFRGEVESLIKDGQVHGLKVYTDQVTDISPVRALKGLKTLDCGGSALRQGRVSDLTPLRGLPLRRLNCSESQVANLEPLRGMSLEIFHCHMTGVSSLAPLEDMKLSCLTIQGSCVTDLNALRGMPLKGLDMASVRGVTDLTPLEDMPLTYLNLTEMLVSDLSVLASLKSLEWLVLDRLPVSDLSPLRGLALTQLSFLGTRVTDLTPLLGMPLERVRLDFRPEDEKILRSLPALTMINEKPAAQFWKELESK
jgi:Leucine-rich repeat (LRR) protein